MARDAEQWSQQVSTGEVNAAANMVGSPGGPLELTVILPQPASSTIGSGQFTTADPATGYVEVNDGTVGYRLATGLGGPSIKISDSNPTAGLAFAELFQGTETGMLSSTGAGDAITAVNVGEPFFIGANQTPGLLPVVAGVDRSFGGLIMAMQAGSTTIPRILTGVVGGLLGRLSHLLGNSSAGTIAYAADATAATDLASAANPFILPRAAVRGKIRSITIIPSASLAATSGDNSTITFVKVDTTGAVALASSPTVGTFTTTTALVAGQPVSFTLSGTAANLLFRTTDRIGWYRTHAASGAVIPASAICANLQVI